MRNDRKEERYRESERELQAQQRKKSEKLRYEDKRRAEGVARKNVSQSYVMRGRKPPLSAGHAWNEERLKADERK